MSFISKILSENLINALGWTLVHSLWQGAAAAVGFALLMIFMRKYRSQTRYYIGVMTIILVLAMTVVTFVGIYSGGAAGAVFAGQNPGSAAVMTGTVEMEGSGYIVIFFKNYFNRHLPLLVTAWLLGILVLVLRFAGGFIYNQRVKVHRTRPLSKNWQNRLESLCRGIGIQKSVRLVESALVKMPMTIGHLKPVILFPLGLVTGLPRDQVEALLAHELAHISRKDYLVNIVQNLVDIIFFYHPGVRWISSHVRTEREHCCDDIAVSVSGDSLNFAKALTNIQVTGRGLNSIEPAVAASGKRHGLLARVKRLLSPPVMGSRFTEGFIGASILAVCLLTLVVSANAAAAMNRDMADMQKSTAAVDSKTDAEERIQAEEEARKKQKMEELYKALKAEKLELEKQEDQFIEMEEKLRKLNTEPTEEQKLKLQQMKDEMKKRKYKMMEMEEFLAQQKEKMFGHDENLEKKLAAFKEETMVLKRQEEELKKIEEKVRKEGKELSKEEKEKFKQQEIELKKRELELKEKESLLKMEIEEMRTRERARRGQEKEMREQEREMRELERQLRTEERQKRKQEEQYIKQKLQVMQDEMRMREEIAQKLEKKIQEATEKKIEEKKIAELKAELEKQNDALKKKEALYKRYMVEVKEKQKELEKKRAILKGFETELVRDKLVEKGGDFEFKLGKDGLFINGVKQPKKVFKKYKELYKKLTGKELSDSGFQIVLNGRV